MPPAIPSTLSPYVSLAPQGSLTLITSVLDSTPNWLILRYVYAALYGQELKDKQGAFAENIGQDHRDDCKVIFVSILRSFEQWREMGKKMGLDFPSLLSNKRLTYINGLIDSPPLSSSLLHNPNVINLNLGGLQDLETLVHRHAEQNQESEHEGKTILVMDGLDFLLASQPLVTSLGLSRTIMTVRQHVLNTIVTSSADYPLLHNSLPSATPLEREHRAFVATMAHQSRLVVQLRSLGTGAAKDISGVLRISAGGAHDAAEAESADFEEGEWLYQVKGDGSIKVWEHGE